MRSALRSFSRIALAARSRYPCPMQNARSYPHQSFLPRHLCSVPISQGIPSDAVNRPKPRLHMVFTCKKCDTRAVKSFTKDAYEKGVVLITCPGCQGRHVIADNLAWFGEDRNVEKTLSKKGETVKRITDRDVDFSP